MNENTNEPRSDREIEARLLAMVMGEASDFEIAELQRLIAENPELDRLHSEMKLTDSMLRVVGQGEWESQPDEWKLPNDRRSLVLGVLREEVDGSVGKLPIAPPELVKSGLPAFSSRYAAIALSITLIVVLSGFLTWESVFDVRQASAPAASVVKDPEDFETNTLPELLGVTASEQQNGRTNLGPTPAVKLETSSEYFEGADDLGLEPASELPALSRHKEKESVSKFHQRYGKTSSRGRSLGEEEPSNKPSRKRGLTWDWESKENRQDTARLQEDASPKREIRFQQETLKRHDVTVDYVIPQQVSGGGAYGYRLQMAPQRPNSPSSNLSSTVGPEGERRRSSNLSKLTDLPIEVPRYEDQRSLPDSAAPIWVNVPTPGPTDVSGIEGAGEDEVDSLPLLNLYADFNEDPVAQSSGGLGGGYGVAAQRRPGLANGVIPTHWGFLSPTAEQKDRSNDRFIGPRAVKVRQLDESIATGAVPRPAAFAPRSMDEVRADSERFSTFSLHVSDVSFKLARASLSKGEWPNAEQIRIEEFVNAFDYGDPTPSHAEKVACRVEQCVHPYLQQRNLVRIGMRTSADGRADNIPLHVTLLLDSSGSMERSDRQQAVQNAVGLLASELKETDRITLISFARRPRLLADHVRGNQASQMVQLVEAIPSEGGTNMEAALELAYAKAKQHWQPQTQSRIVLLTDGAVNLGNAEPAVLSKLISRMRDDKIAFDVAGIVANGLQDQVLETLARQGDGRYYLLESVESVDDQFVQQIAGSLRPSAKNVKVQVEFNPQRIGNYKLLGFEKHRLQTEDFRDDNVDAAEMAAAESGIAIYQVQVKPDGHGDIGSVSVRFQDLSTGRMVEHRWPIPYQATPPAMGDAKPSMRLAATAALFAARLKGDPVAQNVRLNELHAGFQGSLTGIRSPARPQQLLEMINQASLLRPNQ